jgi:hypothetical protein
VKRISFNEQRTEHIYEWLRMCWQGTPKKFGGDVEYRGRAHDPEDPKGPVALHLGS